MEMAYISITLHIILCSALPVYNRYATGNKKK